MSRTPTRRRFLRVAVAGVASGVAGCGQPTTTATPRGTPTDTDGTDATRTGPTESPTTGTDTETETDGTPVGSPPDSVGLETLVSGLQTPVDVAFAPTVDRRYVATQPGRVFVHEPDGLREEPFLDIRDTVVTAYEMGLLGIELHPDFGTNRRVFVRYSAPSRAGTPASYSHTFVLAEFEATADGRRAKRDTERTVLEIPEPQGNHNSGDVRFGPDGYLYVGVGDGGGGGDQGTGHVQDWYDAVDGGNGQDVTENLLGSLLRIDVDDREDGHPYAIPDDNPLVGREGLDEHYAWGLRNPWRTSFDGTDYYVADVGQRGYEEVNLVEKGGNYGWNVLEGTHCYQANTCPDRTPGSVRDGESLVDPIIEYPRSGAPVSGVSVIGGYVYRGSAVPGLVGTYVFGDLRAEGRLFVATRPDDGGLWPTRVVSVAGDGGRLGRIFSFGRDHDDDLYVLGSGADAGGLHRITAAE